MKSLETNYLRYHCYLTSRIEYYMMASTFFLLFGSKHDEKMKVFKIILYAFDYYHCDDSKTKNMHYRKYSDRNEPI